MASILDRFKRNIVTIFQNNPFSISYGTDKDYLTVDDLDIVLDRKADDVITGTLVVVDANGKPTNKPVPQRLLSPNMLQDYKEVLRAAEYGLDKNGVARFWVTKSGYSFLEECNCKIDYKNRNILTLTKYSDIYSQFIYSSGGRDIDLLREDGEIVSVFDIGYSQTDYKPISRINKMSQYVKMSGMAVEAAQGMFRRVSMMFLFKKGSNTIPNTNLSDITRQVAVKDNETFNKDYTLGKNAVSVLPSEMGSIEANPDNRKLDAKTYLDHSFGKFCQMWNVPEEHFGSETKYDDLKVINMRYYGLALPTNPNKIIAALSKAMGIKERVIMGYSNIVDLMTPQETETTSTEEAI